MISDSVRARYSPAIGIECHVQLKTKTKLFAAVGNNARGAKPNTLISYICLGMPGALPVLNQAVIGYAARAAFAFGTKPQRHSYFERKHYFYPDLPKGYQITQLSKPIIVGGFVEIEADGKKHTVRINRVQIEEDAGKSIHPEGKDYSLVDLNRAGTPLFEIVSEPDIRTPAEARAYARELWLLMRYTDVSDADLYHGNMRFDVNVSVSNDPKKLGLRTETKNLNSFKSVEKAVEYEINRQIELLEKGQQVVQETRGWDDARAKTFSQRTKEDAHDYRYFPDPDIPPIELTVEQIDAVEKDMPSLPHELRTQLKKHQIDHSAAETLVEEIPAGRFMLGILASGDDNLIRRAANWLASDVQALVAGGGLTWETARLDEAAFRTLASLVKANKISSTSAKIILADLVTKGGDPEKLAKAKNLLQVSDESAIAEIVAQVLAGNPQAAEDVKSGELKAIGYLVGQVMKASRGQANPTLAQQLIKKQLDI